MNFRDGNEAQHVEAALLATATRLGLTSPTTADTPGPNDVLHLCGLTSFDAVRFQRILDVEYDISLPLADLMGDMTIAQLARLSYPHTGEANGGSCTSDVTNTSEPQRSSSPDGQPLSDLQTAYWIGRSEEFELGGVGSHWCNDYVLDVAAILRSPLAIYVDATANTSDVDRALSVLEIAWRMVLQHYPLLRSAVTEDGTLKVQRHDCRNVGIDRIDLRDHDSTQALAALESAHHALTHLVFDPQKFPLFALTAILLPEGAVRLYVSCDAILLDFRSWTRLMEIWGRTVRTPFQQQETRHALPHPTAPSPAALARAQQFWSQQPLYPAPTLPLTAADARTETRRYQRVLPHKSWEKVTSLCTRYGVSPSALVLAVYALTLDRFRILASATAPHERDQAQRDNAATPHHIPTTPHGDSAEGFSINLTVYDQPADTGNTAEDPLLGDFSTTALCDVPPIDFSAPMLEFLRAMTHTLWQCVDHRAYPASRERQRRQLAAGESPLRASDPIVFTSTLGVGDADCDAWLGTKLTGLSQTPQVLVDHLVWERDNQLVLTWDVRCGAWPEGYWDSFADACLRGVEQLASEETWTGPTLGWMPFHVPMEEPTNLALPEDQGLIHDPWLVARERYPERTALRCGVDSMTHGELHALVDDFAARLAAHRRTSGDTEAEPLVVIALPKSIGQIVATLAVVRSGAAYVPVDPSWPARRVASVLRTAAPVLALVAPGSDQEVFRTAGITVCEVDAYGHCVSLPAAAESLPNALPEQLAYIIFTSGSTGEPKGVAIEHRQARTTIDDIISRMSIGPYDTVVGVSALSFDLSVFDIFGVLGSGGCLVVPEPQHAIDPLYLTHLVDTHQATVWNSAPATFELVVDSVETLSSADHPTIATPWPLSPTPLSSLRDVFLSGDWIPIQLPGRLHQISPTTRVHSLGGATEAAIWSITYPLGNAVDASAEHRPVVDPAWTSIPYGRALTGQQFFILDDAGQPCRLGVAGELHIGGAGVARGYFGAHEKTAERFIHHPALQQRLYRTGDLGHWRADGTIEFLGRNDRQVKINGFRIELGDIEAALQRLPGVRGALVQSVAGPDGRPRLVAYVAHRDLAAAEQQGKDPSAFDTAAMLAALRTQLPSYMVPHRIVGLPALPLTANGKVDVAALTGSTEAPASTVASNTQDTANASAAASHPPVPQAGEAGDGVLEQPAPDGPDADPPQPHHLVCAVEEFLSQYAPADRWGTATLLQLGLDSLGLVRLATLWERHGLPRPRLAHLIQASSAQAIIDDLIPVAASNTPACVDAARFAEPHAQYRGDTPAPPIQSTQDTTADGSADSLLPHEFDRGSSPAPTDAAFPDLRVPHDGATEVHAVSPDTTLAALGGRLRALADTVDALAALDSHLEAVESLLKKHNDDNGTTHAHADASPPVARASAHEKHDDAMPLNEMQLAYFFGRATPFYGAHSAAHYYGEVELPDFDPQRFQQAWDAAVSRFTCLRLRATENAQTITDPGARVTVHTIDISDWQEEHQDRFLRRLREETSTRVLPLTQAPLVGITAVRTTLRATTPHSAAEGDRTKSVWRLVVDLDVLFIDAASAVAICDAVMREYVSPGTVAHEPPVRLPLENKTQQPEPQGRREEDNARPLPAPGPSLPLSQIGRAAHADDPQHPAGTRHRYVRWRHEFNSRDSATLRRHAAQAGMTITEMAVCALAFVLSPGKDCSLIVTTNPTALMHPGETAGELTYTALLTVPLSRGLTAARSAVHRDYWDDIGRRLDVADPSEIRHANMDLRRLREAGISTPTVSLSSAAGVAGDASQLFADLGTPVYAISQTPGMLLDVQLFEQHDRLVMNWDANVTIVDEARLDEMFRAFLTALLVPMDELEMPAQDTSQLIAPVAAVAHRTEVECSEPPVHAPTLEGRTRAELRDLLIAALWADDPHGAAPDVPWFDQGLSSLDLVAGQQSLATQGIAVTVVDMLTHPTVTQLCDLLIARAAAHGSPPTTAPAGQPDSAVVPSPPPVETPPPFSGTVQHLSPQAQSPESTARATQRRARGSRRAATAQAAARRRTTPS
ncbi:hypothetical protein C1Y63_00850 [Corynebacterium sp. 13CS0277]|uniref:non-ribosomal peptide synthetase n=1 Tax=Corynebacterium sp. 13CS0277 TaxID=2071994 RepID=UPI000D036ED8|nr:non-ribosomal peptide synthetase [Corynebacterium sp. 13CS0277]PRQ12374.1 hypothetical protein C1Y63_00850 [Corynebacterium sp. 13CS0277]